MIEVLITILLVEKIVFGTILFSVLKKPKVVVIRRYEEIFGEEDDLDLYELTKEEEKEAR